MTKACEVGKLRIMSSRSVSLELKWEEAGLTNNHNLRTGNE